MMNHPQHNRYSPSSRNLPSSALSNPQHRPVQGQNHKRSPTAPDISTSGLVGPSGPSSAGQFGRTWAAGDEDHGTESEQEKDRGRHIEAESMRERGKSREPVEREGSTRTVMPRPPAPRPTSAPVPPPTTATAPAPAQTAVAGRQIMVPISFLLPIFSKFTFRLR